MVGLPIEKVDYFDAAREKGLGTFDEDQIEKLVQEVDEYREEDQQRRDLIELSNKSDGLIYSTERTLEEFAVLVSDDERSAIAAASRQARDPRQIMPRSMARLRALCNEDRPRGG